MTVFPCGTAKDATAIIISGTAGQGAVFSSTLIAKAAASVGKHVSQTARSSAAVRSGRSTAHVIVSKTPVVFPFIDSPDIFIALSEQAFTTVRPGRLDTGLVVYDASLIASSPAPPAVAIPIRATEAARDAHLPAANLVLVGAALHLIDVFPFQAVLDALNDLEPSVRDADRRALLLGRRLAEDTKAGS